MTVERTKAPAEADQRAARRLAIYLGNLKTLRSGTFEVRRPYPGLLLHGAMSPAEAAAHLSDPSAGHPFLHFTRRPKVAEGILRHYVAVLIELHRAMGEMRPFLLVPGDTRTSLGVPGFAKARNLWQPGLAVLQPLRIERHFRPLDEVRRVDIPFEEKAPRLVWRGATTDAFARTPRRPHLGSRAFIPQVMDRVDPARFDIGFSAVTVAPRRTERPVEELARYVRPPLSMAQQLACRYLLMLEGNDVASGLKWALGSNSVVLMPQPTVESWACESLLRPYVHFVPVRPDLSDLEAQVDWCDRNAAQCREIAQRGRRFVAQFRSEAAEDHLAREVVREYHRRVRLVVD